MLSIGATVDVYRSALAAHRAYLPALRHSPMERLNGLPLIGDEARTYVSRDYGTFNTPRGPAYFGRCGAATDFALFRRGLVVTLVSVSAGGCVAGPGAAVRGRPDVLMHYARLIDSRIQRTVASAPAGH